MTGKKNDNAPLTMEQVLQMECEGLQYEEALRGGSDPMALAMLEEAERGSQLPGLGATEKRGKHNRDEKHRDSGGGKILWLPIRCPFHREFWQFCIHKAMIIPGTAEHQYELHLGCARKPPTELSPNDVEIGDHWAKITERQAHEIVALQRAGKNKALFKMIRGIVPAPEKR